MFKISLDLELWFPIVTSSTFNSSNVIIPWVVLEFNFSIHAKSKLFFSLKLHKLMWSQSISGVPVPGDKVTSNTHLILYVPHSMCTLLQLFLYPFLSVYFHGYKYNYSFFIPIFHCISWTDLNRFITICTCISTKLIQIRKLILWNLKDVQCEKSNHSNWCQTGVLPWLRKINLIEVQGVSFWLSRLHQRQKCLLLTIAD